MDQMLIFIPIVVFVGWAAFNAGMAYKSYPSEEEMIRRIVESRVKNRTQREVEAEVAAEIDRKAAHS